MSPFVQGTGRAIYAGILALCRRQEYLDDQLKLELTRIQAHFRFVLLWSSSWINKKSAQCTNKTEWN